LPAVSCRFPSPSPLWNAVYSLQQKAIASFDNAHALDLYDAICPGGQCALEGPGFLYYSDESHLTTRFSRSLSSALAHQLDRVMRQRRFSDDPKGPVILAAAPASPSGGQGE
jgi:hypothetical protein